jgi:hypothetical protein
VGGGFERYDHAQAVVETESMLVMVAQVTQAANDQEPVAPMLERWQVLPEGLSQPEEVAANNGDFSENHVNLCEGAGIAPRIAIKREEHHPHWSERFRETGEVPPVGARSNAGCIGSRPVPGGRRLRGASRPSNRSSGSSNP